jgi:hypothetical protein
MNEISCYIYEYLVQTAELKVINSVVMPENQVGYNISYENKDKFKTDYLNGRLEFSARPDVSQEDLLSLINGDVEATKVKELQQSTLLTNENPGDLQAPVPQESIIAKKINKSNAIRMKDANKVIDWFAPSQLPEKIAEGWLPTNREMMTYPILTEDDKVKWTINVSELGAVFAANQKIYIVDVNKLVDAEMFRQMFPEKKYPDCYVVCSDSTPAPAPANEEPAPANGPAPEVPEVPTEMPAIPEGGAQVPTV